MGGASPATCRLAIHWQPTPSRRQHSFPGQTPAVSTALTHAPDPFLRPSLHPSPCSGFIRAPAANTVCKSFRLCHNSRGLAWTSIEVFTALEPLFDQLKLSPMSDFVDVVAAPSVEGCSCSTPVEVQLSFPVAPGSPAELLVNTVAAFIEQQLPKMGDAICVTPLETVPCANRAAVVAESRRRLR